MNRAERDRFDGLVEEAIDALPDRLHELLDEVPVVVLDRPSADMLRDLGIDPADEEAILEMCGLHTGTPETEHSFEAPAASSSIHLFREGVVALAGGWTPLEDYDPESGETGPGGEDAVYEEIMVTLLHEMGHQFGLDEDDLRDLGYD